MTGAAVAARAAGVALAVPFLAGLLPGSIAAAGAGVILAGFARAAGPPGARLYPIPAVLVYGGAVAVGVARWNSLDLDVIRGVQAVLGPTVTVEPQAAAAASIAAAVAGVIALGLWLGAPRPAELWIVEAAVGALLLVTVFWGPALPGLGAPGTFGRMTLWVGLSVAVAATAGAIGAWTFGRGAAMRYGLIVVAGVGVAAAAALLDRAL